MKELTEIGRKQLTNIDISKQKQYIHKKGENFGDALSKAIDTLVDLFIKK